MNATYINTLDGRTKVDWWSQDKFKCRSTKIYGGDSFGNMKLNTIIPIPDDCVLCDFCNFRITTFPVLVLWNSYALCPKCFKEVQK